MDSRGYAQNYIANGSDWPDRRVDSKARGDLGMLLHDVCPVAGRAPPSISLVFAIDSLLSSAFLVCPVAVVSRLSLIPHSHNELVWSAAVCRLFKGVFRPKRPAKSAISDSGDEMTALPRPQKTAGPRLLAQRPRRPHHHQPTPPRKGGLALPQQQVPRH